MLNHCKNNTIPCKINDICIARMLNHCKNNVIHYKINDICIANTNKRLPYCYAPIQINYAPSALVVINSLVCKALQLGMQHFASLGHHVWDAKLCTVQYSSYPIKSIADPFKSICTQSNQIHSGSKQIRCKTTTNPYRYITKLQHMYTQISTTCIPCNLCCHYICCISAYIYIYIRLYLQHFTNISSATVMYS